MTKSIDQEFDESSLCECQFAILSRNTIRNCGMLCNDCKPNLLITAYITSDLNLYVYSHERSCTITTPKRFRCSGMFLVRMCTRGQRTRRLTVPFESLRSSLEEQSFILEQMKTQKKNAISMQLIDS